MAYSIPLYQKIKAYLQDIPNIHIQEKNMFGGLAFMINGKMCICISGENLMCRFDPAMQTIAEQKKGFEQMIMKGRQYKGYCYVTKEGYDAEKDFNYWVKLCIDFNAKAKSSKKTSK